jgi:hypothetical protein
MGNQVIARPVFFLASVELAFQRAIYTIVALLPVEADGRPRYRIKSREENFERVLTEELLGRKN